MPKYPTIITQFFVGYLKCSGLFFCYDDNGDNDDGSYHLELFSLLCSFFYISQMLNTA